MPQRKAWIYWAGCRVYSPIASPAPGFGVLGLQISFGTALYGTPNLIFRRDDVIQLAGLKPEQ
jgi:hypothetical protein